MRIILSVKEDFPNMLNIFICIGVLQFKILEGFPWSGKGTFKENTDSCII